MNAQFHTLYREFLFRIVDREHLSTHATGDASQLLLQLIALLFFMSALFSAPALAFPGAYPQPRLMFSWSIEHFLIATTMLVVGIFAVLSWTALFPDHRDVLVLAPLPIRAHTILLAKLAAVATALGLAVLVLHVAAGIVWPAALNTSARAHAIPALTFDAAIPPVGAADLQAVLNRDLARALRDGPLGPHTGGGIAIGVYTRGVRRVFAYGVATPSSIFGIASVTKPFTALVLAHMVAVGQVRFDQPVRELIPAARLSQPAGREITLLDLATHHSGLPLVPPYLRPTDRANPFAEYDVTRLYAYLAGRGVAMRSGTAFAYSNVGFGLLGHALAVRAGLDYASLVQQLITRPLGLSDTGVRVSPEQERRLLQGHNDDREPVPPWDLAALAGAGALHSTASDMLTWLESNLHPEKVQSATLSAALVSSQLPRASMGSSGRVALAWMIDPASGDVIHPGNGGGFSADAFFNARDDVAVVVLSNLVVGTAASADVVAEHVRARLRGKPAISIAEMLLPATGGLRHWLRISAAYGLTMLAAGIFILSTILGLHALAADLLPHRHFLRLSSLLQLGAFGLIVGVYFLQPMVVQPGRILLAQHGGTLAWSPSYWFLGLFQALSGSAALAPLAHRAVIGLGVAIFGTVIAYSLSYLNTLRRIAEQPDVIPGGMLLRWLPRFGGPFSTAIVQFSLRTLSRSAPHRLIVAFYWGVGFALTAVLLKTPRAQAEDALVAGWREMGVALLVSSILIMGAAVLAAKLAFAMPRDLRANWILRTMPLRGGRQSVVARRRALVAASVVPVWGLSAAVFLSMWPIAPAVGHLAVLGLLGLALAEICLQGVQKLPFMCSYLPGKSRVHVWIYVLCVALVPLIFVGAEFEQDLLQNPPRLVAALGVLSIVLLVVRWRTTWAASVETLPAFEDEPAERVLTLDVWDTRFTSNSVAPTTVPSATPPPSH